MRRGLVWGLPVATVLMAAASRPAPKAFEIELRMNGYTGLAQSKDCDNLTDPNSHDVLTGVVREVEGGDDEVQYAGTLTRSTRMDYCLARAAPTADQAKWCVARLVGGALMEVSITVYGEAGRGAWVEAEPKVPSPFAPATVTGDCEAADTDEIRDDYPSGESAGSPSGQPIEENPRNPMYGAGGGRLREGSQYPAKPPQTLWSLKVIRAVP
jgi:hypothetical protein